VDIEIAVLLVFKEGDTPVVKVLALPRQLDAAHVSRGQGRIIDDQTVWGVEKGRNAAVDDVDGSSHEPSDVREMPSILHGLGILARRPGANGDTWHRKGIHPGQYRSNGAGESYCRSEIRAVIDAGDNQVKSPFGIRHRRGRQNHCRRR
jgi:hypothetical protein